MLKKIVFPLSFAGALLLVLSTSSCIDETKAKTKTASEDAYEAPEAKEKMSEDGGITEAFKKYWFAGEAEITSYTLEQARYGEIRKGTSVLIYVTEPFLPEKQVKADYNNPENVQVLKLNSTKNFLTGIYPYAIMSSTFHPLKDDQHAIKTSFSSQEWCGQVYAQINNREQFEITSHSYFEREADESFKLPKDWMENEIWNKIRIAPENLPQGKIKMIPSLEFLRLKHGKVQAYEAETSLTAKGNNYEYVISYPDLKRDLSIVFSKAFPHTIESWSETFVSGYGPNAKTLTTTGKKLKQLKTAYWSQNANKHLFLRDSLGI
ncbi:MAG: septum formation inhibitor Maf [Bacteroidota bacterium]